MARRSALRASDDDRERVAERLRNATAEGRILAEELEERLGTVFSARTYGELDSVLADLPAPRPERQRAPLWAKATLALAIVLAMIAVLAVVALVAVGLAGAWVAWVVLAWVFFGRHGGRRSRRRGHSRPGWGPPPRVTSRRGVPRGGSASL